MSVYVLTYELSQREEEYSDLWMFISSRYDWCHYIESTWFISTDENVEEIYKRLRPFFKGDNFIIAKIENNKQGWLPRTAWKWFRDKFEVKRDYGDNEEPLMREELNVLPNMSIN